MWDHKENEILPFSINCKKDNIQAFNLEDMGYETSTVGQYKFDAKLARFNVTCCSPNKDIYAEREDRDQEFKVGVSREDFVTVYLKDWLEEHHASCSWKPGRKEFASKIQYNNWYVGKKKKGGFFDGWTDPYGYTSMTAGCGRLEKKFDGDCIKMRSGWSAGGYTMWSLDGLRVDCAEGMKENGRKVGPDGKRRFLTELSFERRGDTYRYVYQCCRIQV